ncbi:imidazole glycerol phosphate synthase subunit HisH [Thermomonas sp.]|uniref:imidazole glycerol phosphate synthase subunit HisH n=1 Tax=Thermomonas sp. TaxID=1971895 RepID=UPI0024896157|nr:imidazole glycerol phosphate synthase subunit HisH [Thermomonas sp.]MDI1252954.1 imidazole glycerol phosphate synthase subunit HisH [Thermomonas sp.]
MANDVALIDAGGANLGSVRYALERLGVDARIVRDANGLHGAQRVILPGVGAAAPAMALLRERGLDVALRALDAPLLGICLGMQLLFDASEEGDVACLGLLPGTVRRMQGSAGLRVPHMGWNTLEIIRESALLDGIAMPAHAYFVHGYATPVTDDCIASCTHGDPFAACVQRGRIAGMQFHPERSADVGSTLLSNFLRWNPE